MGAEESNDGGKVTPKDLYKEVWEGRNFEISNLWQRSVFLAVFTLAIAAAYGEVLAKMIFPEDNSIYVTSTQHLAAWGLCCLGLIFSMLWIMMAKGSKLWYEKYEKAINWFVWNSEIMSDISGEMPYHGNLPKFESKNISNNLLSTMPGYYSVSRVNITIGIVTLLVYGLMSIIHFGKFLHLSCAKLNFLQCGIFGIAQLVLFYTISYFILKILCGSWEGIENE